MNEGRQQEILLLKLVLIDQPEVLVVSALTIRQKCNKLIDGLFGIQRVILHMTRQANGGLIG